jgi:GH15 family glucan-1,4-alpha-glucosidase
MASRDSTPNLTVTEPVWGGPHERRDKPIESYGLIGDLRSAALVGEDGSIDWFCPRRFDGPSIFAALLDHDRGGAFRIAPVQGIPPRQSKQMYLPDTGVLITRFYTDDGVGEVTDFMPPRLDPCALVRRVDVVRGQMAFRARCAPAFDYAREGHRVEVDGAHARFAGESGSTTDLVASRELHREGDAAEARFSLRAGQRAWFVVQPATSTVTWGDEMVESELARTIDFWRTWLARCSYDGRWRETVQRSAITLKLLTYEPTGAIVAAPTTSLPETLGGNRNWDYRYTWLRDSAFTAFALWRLGFLEEARAFLGWLEARLAETDPKNPQLQIMYGIDGRKDLVEEELTHLSGWRDSHPVRIGNGAYGQLQLDVYGELMDAVYLVNKIEPISIDLWENLRRTLDWLVANWQQPDAGIWEVRGGAQHFTYSRMMSWVAFDRALRMQSARGLPGPTVTWSRTRDHIFEEVMREGWSEERQAFVQSYGSTTLDASNLLMPLVKFIGPRDPKMLATLEATAETLVSDSLVYRYDPEAAADDGLDKSKEGSFSLCSFWWVECLTRAHRLDQARLAFEKMLTYASPIGLYAEEVGDTGEALGNYPQAFTHLALISAAYDLNRALGE